MNVCRYTTGYTCLSNNMNMYRYTMHNMYRYAMHIFWYTMRNVHRYTIQSVPPTHVRSFCFSSTLEP